MGSRGPVGRSTADLKLLGLYKPSRHARREVTATTGEPTKPKGMSGAASTHWDATVPELVRLGIVGKVDTSLLAALCRSYAAMEATQKLLDENPMDADARRSHQTYFKQWTKLADMVGLTPSSRRRLAVEPKEQSKATIAGFSRKRS